MRLNMHTARYFSVHGSQGVRTLGRTSVYSTTTPFFFAGRVVLETGEGNYQIIDGTMTNCRLPKPDWQIISRSIKVQDGKASTANALFKFSTCPFFTCRTFAIRWTRQAARADFLSPSSARDRQSGATRLASNSTG